MAEPGAPIRIAAVGDVHLGEDARGRHRADLEVLADHADVLLLAGDLTRHGSLDEARVVADEYRDLPVPVLGVLGNHDHHGDAADEIAAMLVDAGVRMLQGEGVVLDVAGRRLGVAGVKGFGGGFAGRCAGNFGEPEMRAFVDRSDREAAALATALSGLDADVRVALTHFSPTPETLRGEPVEIWPFLGSQQLADVVDGGGVDLAIHGHAHLGTESGTTAGGVPVRNVAQPIRGGSYVVYALGAGAVTGSAAPGPRTR